MANEPERAVRTVVFFESDSGRSPVAEYIEAQTPVPRALIIKALQELAAKELHSSNFFKKMQGRGELWEVRIKQHRLMGFHTRRGEHGPREFVLVSAFPKQSQKTPRQEIEVALRRRGAYLARRGTLE